MPDIEPRACPGLYALTKSSAGAKTLAFREPRAILVRLIRCHRFTGPRHHASGHATSRSSVQPPHLSPAAFFPAHSNANQHLQSPTAHPARILPPTTQHRDLANGHVLRTTLHLTLTTRKSAVGRACTAPGRSRISLMFQSSGDGRHGSTSTRITPGWATALSSAGHRQAHALLIRLTTSTSRRAMTFSASPIGPPNEPISSISFSTKRRQIDARVA